MSAKSGLRRVPWLGLAAFAAVLLASFTLAQPALADGWKGERNHGKRHYRSDHHRQERFDHRHNRSRVIVVTPPRHVHGWRPYSAPRPVVVLRPPIILAPPPVVYQPRPVVVERPYWGAPAQVVQPVPSGNDLVCREYQAPAQVGGVLQQSYGTACLQPDGSWRIVN